MADVDGAGVAAAEVVDGFAEVAHQADGAAEVAAGAEWDVAEDGIGVDGAEFDVFGDDPAFGVEFVGCDGVGFFEKSVDDFVEGSVAADADDHFPAGAECFAGKECGVAGAFGKNKIKFG